MTKEERSIYEKERRKTLKLLHRCQRCGKQDAFTLAGRSWCATCLEHRKEKGYRGKNQAEYHRSLRADRRAQGLCPECGKRRPADGKMLCKQCSIRSNKHRKRPDNWPRGDNGFCYCCNKREALPGYRVCQECYEKLAAAMAAMKNQREAIHPWEADEKIRRANLSQKARNASESLERFSLRIGS